MESKEHPAIFRNSLTSPAGTTASAIYELEDGKFRTVIKDAIWACYRRSLEMGGADSNVGPGRISFLLLLLCLFQRIYCSSFRCCSRIRVILWKCQEEK